MNLPYQAPAVDRANRASTAMAHAVDPALFGISLSDVADTVGRVGRFLAPHAKEAAIGFGHSVLDDL